MKAVLVAVISGWVAVGGTYRSGRSAWPTRSPSCCASATSGKSLLTVSVTSAMSRPLSVMKRDTTSGRYMKRRNFSTEESFLAPLGLIQKPIRVYERRIVGFSWAAPGASGQPPISVCPAAFAGTLASAEDIADWMAAASVLYCVVIVSEVRPCALSAKTPASRRATK